MSFDNKKLSYYIFKDLRAAQNNNIPEGNEVLRFDSLSEAIAEFQRLPTGWTTALGIHISPVSELDLVQRRDGTPVLSGDYQRIPEYFGNSDVQAAVRTLVDELNIEWQSDYRVFGHMPVQIPVVLDHNFTRDRILNGKHLDADDLQHSITAVQELYVPEQGWQPLADVYAEAEKFGYACPHTPRVTTLHVRYADEKGQVRTGDMNPYNFILLQERTKIMAQDPTAIKCLAQAIDEYIDWHDTKRSIELFGDEGWQRAPVSESLKRTREDLVASLIKDRDLTYLVESILSVAERGLADPFERAETRELLGRILNIPDDGEKKLPIDLRMRASAVMEDFYREDTQPEKAAAPAKPITHEEGR